MAALAFFLGAYFYHYRGTYDAPATPDAGLAQITAPYSSFTGFVEVPPVREGTFLVDGTHANDFTKAELSALLSRVVDREYDVQLVGEISPFSGFRFMTLWERLPLLEGGLRQADSFAVILPEEPYEKEELAIVERFVQKGGKLLLLGDPTREGQINSLVERFGISFQPDYLYNVEEHDVNYRNIYINNFVEDEITRDLHNITLYTAGSIESSGTGLAFTDGTTRSTLFEGLEPFYPIVKEAEGRVLAIHDFTFLVPPQNSILDNDRLVSNIADFLTDSRRKFELADFPHFFKDDVDILLGGADLFELGTDFKGLLSDFQIDSEVRGIEDLASNTVYLGLYPNSVDVAQYLEVAGIQVNDVLRTPFTPDLATDGTAIILLHGTEGRRVLVVLGHSERALSDAVRSLSTGRFRSGLVSELLGVYRTP